MEDNFYRSVFGYKINIIENKNEENIFYKASIDELDIKSSSQDIGRAIVEVFNQVKTKLKKAPIEPKIDNDNLNYFKSLQVRMFKINQKITSYGFSVIVDDIQEADMQKLELICKEINLNDNCRIEKSKEIEDKIANVMSRYIFSPNIRALNMTSLIINTPHICKFSHLIEQAYISLFRGEYISTVMTLFSVIEGTLLSISNFDINNNKQKEKKLINNWAKLQYDIKKPQMPHPYIIDEYIRAFIDIWEQIFFSNQSSAEENFYFNRHYIAHLMGKGNFYSRNNAFKLVILVDLLAHVLASCNGTHNRFEFDLNDEKYKIREKYYKDIWLKDPLLTINRKLFEGHEYFKGYI